MFFPLFWVLSLFLLLLHLSFALPLFSPSMLDSLPQAFVGGNFNAGAEPHTVYAPATIVVAKTAIWPNSSPTSLPSLDSPVLVLPQDFTKPAPGTIDHVSVASDPGPVIVLLNNTHDLPSTTGTSLTPLMMAYYPSWVSEVFPPERIDFSRFDWIDFAFAVPNDAFALDWDGSDMAPEILSRLVGLAHQQGKKVKLSVGGWDGSMWFSRAVANDSNRQGFVASIVAAYYQYSLDGIDIDWEYPGQPGDPLNYVDPEDTINFLEFLKLLRARLPSTARISAAVQTTTFADANGQPMDDVRAFADVLDWILLMNYDVWGASPNPGSNAPLADGCQNSTVPAASADAAVKAWTAAGFRPSQVALGVPSYGYISRSNATRLRQRDQNAPSFNLHAVTNEGADSGQVEFHELVDQGVLCNDTTGRPGVYVGCGGFTREWDVCSSTPFLHSEAWSQVITYDDVESLHLKATYARQRGLLGVNIFDLHGDTNQWELVDSLRQGLGLSSSYQP